MQFRDPLRRHRPPCIRRQHRHPERRQQPRRSSAPIPPTPTISAVASGRCTTSPASCEAFFHFAPRLPGDEHMQPARERQHESQDMRTDMVVEDFPKVGDTAMDVRSTPGGNTQPPERSAVPVASATAWPSPADRPRSARTLHPHRRSPARRSRHPPPARCRACRHLGRETRAAQAR